MVGPSPIIEPVHLNTSQLITWKRQSPALPEQRLETNLELHGDLPLGIGCLDAGLFFSEQGKVIQNLSTLTGARRRAIT